MKIQNVITKVAVLLALSSSLSQPSTLLAQGTEFTYDGQLNDSGVPANGAYDLQFRLFDMASNGGQQGVTVMVEDQIINNGLLNVTLDFGSAAFDGGARWLEIAVRPGASSGDFTTLVPRQQITATPYAIRAANFEGPVKAAQLTGKISPNNFELGSITGVMLAPGSVGPEQLAAGAVNTVALADGAVTAAKITAGAVVTNNQSGVNLTGSFFGNGAGLTNINLVSLKSGGLITFPGNFVLDSSPAVGNGPSSVVAADVNGDGKADLICANSYGNSLSVLINEGSGGFVLASSPVTGPNPYSVAAADVNGDGKIDLISANISGSPSGTLSVLTNNGSGGFGLASSPVTADPYPFSVAAADVNGDGKADLICANYNANTLSVLTNDDGGFVLASSPVTGPNPHSVAAADVNGDGMTDLISANSGGFTLSVLTNNGGAGFVLASSPVTGIAPYSVAAADVNGDGKTDLISANISGSLSGTLSVLTNNGSGGFVLASSPAVGKGPESVVAGDVNRDGMMDLISANGGDNTLSVLTNNGSSGFMLASSPLVGHLPISVAAADVNGDGKVDLISANYGAGTLSVLFNTPTFTASFAGDGAGLTNVNLSNFAGTIATPGTVANSATTATSANTPNTIVARDGAGNFSAGIITAQLADGTVGANQLANGAVTAAKIGVGAVDASQLAPGAVTTPALANGAVTAAKISTGAVGSTQLAPGAVTTVAMAEGVVVTNNQSGVNLAGSFSGNGGGLTNVPGAIPSQPVPGTSVQAQPNTAYDATSEALLTVNLPANTSIGDVVLVNGLGVGGWQILPGVGQSINGSVSGVFWTPRETSRDWRAVASSADGSKLVAVEGVGQIYNSTDSGTNWTAHESNRNWSSVVSSADGTKLVAVVSGGQIYTSTDSGTTWTARETSRDWRAVASSADGSKLVAVEGLGQIYTSADSGTNWTAHESNRDWRAVASSADGSKLVAVVSGSRIYTSTDSGITWTARASSLNWQAVASSADGSKLVAVDGGGGPALGGVIYTSTDSGTNWTGRGVSHKWKSVASSADGSKLVAVDYGIMTLGGQIYISTDSGATWTARESSRQWASVASSADGGKLVAVVNGDQIYTSIPSPLVGGQGSTAELQYAGNGVWQPLGSSMNLGVGSITATMLSDGSVNTVALANGAVTTAKLAGGAVGANQLADGAVTLAKIAPGAVITNHQTGVTLSGTFSGDGANLINVPGAFPSQIVAGTGAQAQPNTTYLATSASQVTVTLPVNASVGDVVLVNGLGSGGWQTVPQTGQSINGFPVGEIWTPHEIARDWRAIASSGDGSKLVAAEFGGQIYTSVDSGVSWTARESNRPWFSVASSADGSKLVAVEYPGQIYTSVDSGANWTARESNRNWISVASSADGSKLVAAVYEGQIYTSVDGGVTWTAQATPGHWTSVTSSADGGKLAAVQYPGQIYTSADNGATWTARESNRNWQSVISSANGSKLVALELNGFIFTSTDGGANWIPRQGVRTWYSVACSANGDKLTAVAAGGPIYTSSDAGVTWFPHQNNHNFLFVASSADGARLVACGSAEQIYTSTTTATGTQGSTVELQYVGGGVWQRVTERPDQPAVEGQSGNIPNAIVARDGNGNFAANEITWSTGSVLTSEQGGSIELGNSLQTGATPYIDFHFGTGTTEDFNIRMSNDGDGQLTIGYAGSATALAQLSPAGITVNGTFVSSSDRNRKENFQPVDVGEVLAKVAALPLSKWNYKDDTASTHIGPMAQDFYEAFSVGPDDKHIATVDADGVALAAIIGLNQKLEDKLAARDAVIKALQRRLERLEATQSTASNPRTVRPIRKW